MNSIKIIIFILTNALTDTQRELYARSSRINNCLFTVRLGLQISNIHHVKREIRK